MESNEILTATATIGTDLYKTDLSVRSHTLIGDEPVDVGGKDLGPRPGDFMRMALASCTAITLRMYANRKEMDVEQISVSVSSGPFDGKTTYSTDVQIKGNLTDEQEKRMLQIAKLCPVHKTMTNPIEVNTQLSITK